MNVMHYKDYSANIEYSAEDGCFVGHIAGIHDVVGFHGESVSQLKAAFKEAVDDYLETCKKLNRPPQTSHSGKLMLRIDPVIHAKVAMRAEAEGKSLNAWAKEVLLRAVSSI